MLRLLLPLFVLLAGCDRSEKIDLLVINARVYTVDSLFSVAEAMAVDNGLVVETGTTEALLAKFEAADTVDAGGKSVFPGLIDAHCHFTGYATDMWKCSLVGTRSFDEVLQRVQQYAQKAPMHWIYARGWDQNDWPENTYPDNEELNQLFPDRPVFLKRVDGHAALVNQVALDLAGINANTKVAGGLVELKNGKPSGLLLDNAMDLVDNLVPPISDSLALQYYGEAQSNCLASGLTQVQDLGVNEHTADLLRKGFEEEKLKIKVFVLLSDDSTYYKRWVGRGVQRKGRLTVGGFKLYADGALGSRGACLLEQYSDKKGWKGFMLRDQSYLRRVLSQLASTDFQVCTHAIGDSANRVMLELYGEILGKNNNRRWRIEHAQVVHSSDLPLFKKNKVIPSVQPTHATSDMYWAESRLSSERLPTAYAYRSLLQQSGVLPLGTDFPVEDISPIKTFYAAVTRRDAKWYPAEGFIPGESLSREDALRGMTIWASYAIFEEQLKGSLEKGKAADFIILDRDLMRCPEKEILDARVLATFIEGEEVFRERSELAKKR